MAIKQREHRDTGLGYGGGKKKIPTVKAGGIADLAEVSSLIQRAVVKDKDGHDRHFIRHVNRNGTAGGFVESTATVGPDVFIDKTSVVAEEASVTGEARLLYSSRVYGDAVIKGRVTLNGSEVFDEVTISGTSLLKDATISGNHTYHNAKIENETKSDRA